MLDAASASDSLSQLQAWELWFQNVNISSKSLFLGISVQNWGRIGKCLQALAALTVLLDIIGAESVRRFGGWLTGLTTIAKAKSVAMTGFQIISDTIVRAFPDILFRIGSVTRHIRRLINPIGTSMSPSAGRGIRLVVLYRAFRRRIPILLFSKKGVRRKTRWRKKIHPSAMRVQQAEEKFVLPVSATVGAAAALYFLYSEYIKGFVDGVLQALWGTVFIFIFAGAAVGIMVTWLRVLISVILLLTALFATLIDALLIEPTAWVLDHPKNENLIKGIAFGIFVVGFYFDLLAS